MTSRTPTLAELLNALRAGIMRDLRVALPGRIESFDASTGTANVQPMVKETVENDDGTTSQISLGVLTGVPVMFPGGGGLRITFPMAQGDFVWVHFGDRSIDAFFDQGAEAGPDDQRRHALSDAVCYPGVRPTNSAWKNIEASVITAGSDAGSNTDFVALAAKVKAELTELHNKLDSLTTAYNGLQSAYASAAALIAAHTHVVSGAAAALAPSLAPITSNTGSTATAPAAVNDVKCTTFKVRD